MASTDNIPDQFANDDDVLEEFSDLTVRPFMQSTVVAAEYDNNFFDPSKGNTTYNVQDLSEDAIITNWDSLSEHLTKGTIAPKDILSIIELAACARSTISAGRLLQWNARDARVIVSTGELSTTRLMTTKIANSLGKITMKDDDYEFAHGPENPDDDDTNDTNDSTSIKAKAAGYICLCLMRLMKKDPETFMRGIASIQRGFSLFYDTASVTVMNQEFSKAAVLAISDGLRSNPKLGHTMIYHVATGMKGLDRASQDYHMMRFTFCQHVELRGLHAYKQFYELDKVFNNRLPTPVFLTWLTNDSTYKAVMMISDIIKKYDNENKTDEYLWLYARDLNNGYFYDLHTARCRWLVCVLGHLSKSQIPTPTDTQGSPLDLKELKKMSKAEWASAKEYAEIFEEQYTKLTATSEKMNRIQRIFQTKKGMPTPKPNKKRKEYDDMDVSQQPKVVVTENPPQASPQGFPSFVPNASGSTGRPSHSRRDRSRSPIGRPAAVEEEDDSEDGDAPGDV
ncbi:nucleocapsid [Medicago sativa virus 1]|nr:nucleocapsid [Medicago sativa virus 1]